jgi:hypothetical protein
LESYIGPKLSGSGSASDLLSNLIHLGFWDISLPSPLLEAMFVLVFPEVQILSA